jgi:hypothetical protein
LEPEFSSSETSIKPDFTTTITSEIDSNINITTTTTKTKTTSMTENSVGNHQKNTLIFSIFILLFSMILQ